MTIRRQPATGRHRSLCTSVRRHRHPYRSREDEYDTLYGWYRERETELIRALGRLYIVDSDGPLLGRNPERRWDAAGGLVRPTAEFPDTHAAVARSERSDDAEPMSDVYSVDAKLVPWEESASGGRGRVYFHSG